MRWTHAAATVVLFAGGQAALGAVIIDDKSFFAGIEHTFIDFETDGSGAPLDLPFQGKRFIPADEYSRFGFVFSEGTLVWGNLPPATCCDAANPLGNAGDALAAVGSPSTAIGGGFGGFAIRFEVAMHAIGIGVIQDGWTDIPSENIVPTITAFDAAGNQLGVVRLWGDLVDGGFGGPLPDPYGEFTRVPYGFLGLASETPIARLVFTNAGFTSFDDLHFSAIPAPGAGATLGLLTLGALVRRRR